MTDKDEQEKVEKEEKKEEALSSAETEKTEDPREQMISRARFDEVNTKRKDLEAKLETLEKENASVLEKQLVEQGKYKELAEERSKTIASLQPVADQVETYEETLKSVLDAQVEQIPEELRGLVPSEMTTKQQLDYIANNGALLHKTKPYDIGAGKLGGSKNISMDLNSEQKALAKAAGMTEEDYVKYSDKE